MIAGRVEIVERLGEVTLVHLATDMGTVIAKLPGDMAPTRGEVLGLTARRESCTSLGRTSGPCQGRRAGRSPPHQFRRACGRLWGRRAA